MWLFRIVCINGEIGLLASSRFLNCAFWYTYVIRNNTMHTFFINYLIQLYCLRHVSNIEVFILRKTCTCSSMLFETCRRQYNWIKSVMKKVCILLYAFFWVFPPASEFYMTTFRNTLFYVHRRIRLWRWNRHSVPKRRRIKFRRRRITQKNPSYLSAYEDGTDRVFRNVGI